MTDSEDVLLANHQTILNFLDAQRRALMVAGCSKEILDSYSALLAHLRRLSRAEILDLSGKNRVSRKKESSTATLGQKVLSFSLEEIEKLALDEKTSRKILEEIAVIRFSVPGGSMRSFQNVGMLREKIMTRIQNERAHQAIAEVARLSGNRGRSGNG